MGIIDKINRWRGFYSEADEPRQEHASFSLSFESLEDFADPFARSMSMELFKAVSKEKEIEDAVPYVLWGDRPASNEYVYIYRTDVLTDEKLESFEKEHKAFVDGIDPDYKAVVITLLCVENSSPAFESYLNRQPRMEDFRLCELVTGIAFDEKLMHTNILTNCPGEKNARDIRKEFLRMIRVAENYFKG
jgi:hypothetical protein